MFSTNYKGSIAHRAVSFISACVLVVGVFPIAVSAATIFSEDFGTGSSANDIPNWDESGSDNSATTRATAASSGNDSISPNGGRFAVIGMEEWICRSISTSGYNTLTMAYVWRGDSSAEDNDLGKIEYKIGGSCDDSNGWTNLKSHNMDIDNSWSTQSAFSLPNALNNTTFKLRVRADSSNNGEDFRIDGIVINGTALVIDTDGDTIPDTSDNCPSVANVNQANNDNDSMGDACDTDDDNDTVVDTNDNCQFDANLAQTDSDGDQIGNECDESPYTEEQLCEQAGNTWIESDCYTDAEVCEMQEGMSWVEGECVADEVPPTDEEICEAQEGMSWVEGDCVADEVPPTDKELCLEAGNNWVDGSCLTDEDVCVAAGDYWVDGECLSQNIICEIYEMLDMQRPDFCGDEEENTDPSDTDGDGVSDETDNCPTVANADQVDSNENGTGDACENTDTTPTDENNEPTPTNNSDSTGSGGGRLEEACDNNVDDDGDGIYDMMDPGCESRDDKSEEDPAPAGEVLGASTCSATITSYMGVGKNNDSAQVKLLQAFLNEELGLELDVNGEFDRPTHDAVKTFQTKYSDEVLTPWEISDPTGYVYKTTLRMIQMIMCPGSDIPMPELS